MRDSDGNAQRRLPVALELMAPEVEIPAGDTVELADDALPAKLMGGGLGLLGGSQLHTVAEHIDARQLEAAVGAHGLAQSSGLALQGRLLHHVACEHQAVLSAPAAALVREGLGEALAHMIVIMVADGGHSLRQLPEQLRDMRHQILAVGCPEGIGQVVGPGEGHVPLLLREAKGLLPGELGLIGEDGRDPLAELFAHGLQVPLVGHFDEAPHGGLVQGVHIGLAVIPGTFQRSLHIGIPFGPLRRLLFPDLTGRAETPIFVQRHIEAGEQPSLLGAAASGAGVVVQSQLPVVAVGHGGEEQIPCPEPLLLRHDAAGGTGGPPVLVVEPGQHIVRSALFYAGLYQGHMLVA